MARKLERLTPEQEALLPIVRDKWLAHGLSTEPADRAAAVEAVGRAYEAANLPRPPIVVWLGSPLAGAIGTTLLQVGGQVGGQVWGQVWGQVGGQVRGQVWGQVWGQVRGQVWDQVRGQVRGQVGYAVWGQHDAGWLGFYDYFRRTPLAHLVQRLEGLIGVGKAAGWWWPLKGAVVLTDRPRVLHRDGQTRLHCTTGPALAYRDDWSIWAIHGVRVDQRIVEQPETITIEQVWAEPNTEVRRVMIEQLGWDTFTDRAALQLIDETDDPGNPGQRIALYDLPEQVYGEPVRVLICTNGSPERDGTRRRFGLTCPADLPSALAAAAWTFELSADEYAQTARRT